MKVFGAAPDMREAHWAASRDLENELKEMSLNDRSSETMLNLTLRAMEENIPNLLSFSASQVDQYSWERQNAVLTSGPTEDTRTVEVSLFALLRNFVGHQVDDSHIVT